MFEDRLTINHSDDCFAVGQIVDKFFSWDNGFNNRSKTVFLLFVIMKISLFPVYTLIIYVTPLERVMDTNFVFFETASIQIDLRDSSIISYCFIGNF